MEEEMLEAKELTEKIIASVARMKRSGIRDNKSWIPARRASIQATYLQNPVILSIFFYG